MGCLLGKDEVGQPLPAHPQPGAYGHQPSYAQPAAYGQPPAYGQSPAYGQPPAYGQQSAYGQQPAYGQAPPAYVAGQQHQEPAQPEPPFMRTAAPSGASWADYVRTGGPSYIDTSTGLLAGPWAECISWGVRFEHTSDWSGMPEYAGQEGPVGGVLMAFEASVQGRPDGRELMEAANRLEEASHEAEEQGRPLPGLQQSVVDGRPMPSAPSGGFSQQQQQPVYGQQPTYSQQAQYTQDGQEGTYGQKPYGQGAPYGQPPMYGQDAAYGQPPMYGAGAQQPYQQSSAMGGSTLLQSQHQSGGMGTGAKMAMAAAGGMAAGAGAYYVAEHMDDIGQALGGAGQWVAGAAEDVGEFVGDIADDVF